MRKPLPSLNALKAFEAAARHKGFIAAAEELCVSRGAISRHVKLLEDHLGVQLFIRMSKGVKLTEAGSKLQPVLADAFAQIGRGLDQITSATTELRVICTPTISIRWLIPRLEGFRALHPDIDVRLSTGFYGPKGFDPRENDVGFSVMNWPDRAPETQSIALFPNLLTPACSPKLLKGAQSLEHPEDLADHRLLHGNQPQMDWSHWAQTCGVSGFDPRNGDSFPNLDMAIKAAVMGSGVVMSDLVLCRQEFESGTLLAPFPSLVSEGSNGDYCLLIDRAMLDDPKAQAFVDWACKEADADRAYLKSRT